MVKKVKKKGDVKKISRKDPKKVRKDLVPARKDFEVFAKGVERLEELRAELNNLNTKGYGAETASIRSKLKNVSYIPEIEQEMRDLKLKIGGVGGSVKSKDTRDHSHIHKKIKKLEKEVRERKIVSSKKQFSKEEVRKVRSIPKLESQLRSFKEFMENQKKEEKRKKELLKKIDPSVNFLINDKFSLSLEEIKAELSKRLEDKELVIQKQLQEDLESRKKNFELQSKLLKDKYTEEYKERVHKDLKREVNDRFNTVLKKKVDEYKKKLSYELGRRIEYKLNVLDKERKKAREILKEQSELKINKRRLENEKVGVDKKYGRLRELVKLEKEKVFKLKMSRSLLNKLRKDLKRDFEAKKEKLRVEHSMKLEDERNKLKDHFNEEVLAHRVKLNNQMNERLTSEIKDLHLEYEKKKKRLDKGIDRRKNRIEKEKGVISNIKDRLSSDRRKLKEDEENYKAEIMAKLVNEKQEAIRKAVAEKSKSIRNKLSRDFHEKLRLEAKAKEAEFDKKKADLALEVQRKARTLFS